jgi:hypothetical protein
MGASAHGELLCPTLDHPHCDERPAQRVHQVRHRPDVIRHFLALVAQRLNLGLGRRIVSLPISPSVFPNVTGAWSALEGWTTGFTLARLGALWCTRVHRH